MDSASCTWKPCAWGVPAWSATWTLAARLSIRPRAGSRSIRTRRTTSPRPCRVCSRREPSGSAGPVSRERDTRVALRATTSGRGSPAFSSSPSVLAISKVLHVIPSVGPLRGGPSAMVRNLAHSLVQHGIETHVATTDDNGPESLRVPYGVPVIQEGVTYWFFPRQARFYTVSWPLASWLSRRVREFDVVHIHALFSFAALPASYCAKRDGVPYIVRPLGTLNAWGMKHRRPFLKGLSFRFLERRVVDG